MRPSLKLNKRGQIPMIEIVLILSVFIIIAMAAGMIYQKSSERSASLAKEEQAYVAIAETTKAIADLPELRYTLASREDVTIVDMQRAIIFANLVKGITVTTNPDYKNYYSERFNGYSANIHCVYPVCGTPDTPSDVEIFNYEVPDGKNVLMNTVPVLLYNPKTGSQSYGLLVVKQKI